MKRNNIFKGGLIVFILSLLIISCTQTPTEVKLPKLVSNGMVLQRNEAINIWGWTTPNGEISVDFRGKHYQTTADKKGNWLIKLSEQKAGGPYTMKINNIELSDILIGDVWLCSGQSNMELPMRRMRTQYDKIIDTTNNTKIRQFLVPDEFNFEAPQADLNGGKWLPATHANIKEFSAVAFFFADSLYKKYNIPIGLINSALGGSPAESWISENALKKFPNYYKTLQFWKNQEKIDSTRQADHQKSEKWYGELNDKDSGIKNKWEAENIDDSNWKTMQVPGSWEDIEGQFDGSVWFRKEITLPQGVENSTAFLNLGRVKDANETYINGQKTGNITYQYPPLWYDVNAGVLKPGKNVIAVRITNGNGRGKFFRNKPYYLQIGDKKYDLKGNWKYKVAAKMNRPAPAQTFIRWKPAGLYNAMICPLINYNLKGVLWYQGEANTKKSKEYSDLLSTLIETWRKDWEKPNLPFIFPQLPNYMQEANFQENSAWAELRYQQLKTLKIPHTAMTVNIDLGQWNDIHPLEKQPVGQRLAMCAIKIAYGEKDAPQCPLLAKYKVEKEKTVLSFDYAPDGLKTSDGKKVAGFYIAGINGDFKPAKAEIKGNEIVVYNPTIKHPAQICYAWADNPTGVNLINAKGLPASPFRIEIK